MTESGDLPRIDPPPQAEHLDMGEDSRVFRVGPKVLHVYKHPGDLPQLVLYQQTTNLVAPTPFSLPPLSELPQSQLRLQVVPIERVGITAQGLPISEMEFIPGPSLHDISLGGVKLEDKIKELETPEQQRLSKLLGPISDRQAFALRLEYGPLEEMSRYFIRTLKMAGINILPYNTKLLVPNDHTVQLLVTDLCSRLARLRPIRGNAPLT